MSSGNKVDGVREVSRGEADLLQARGVVADLSRDSVIVHVGKPVGSITGWVGPVFWQVWVDVRDKAGTVHARIDQGETETWKFDAALSKEAVLDQAKDRLIAEIQSSRAARLTEARTRLSALEAA